MLRKQDVQQDVQQVHTCHNPSHCIQSFCLIGSTHIYRTKTHGHIQWFTHPSITQAYISSSGSDMNQCTSQVNPGEIEIHLQTSDHNQNHMEAGLPKVQKHRVMAQWGTTVEGKKRRLHLRLCRLLRGWCWWCSGKNTWGWSQRTNTDWQRLVWDLG